MKIERFEDIQAWQLARTLTQEIYRLTRKSDFAKDFGLKQQIQNAAGSSMHNIAEGFDAESNAEFIRFLRYAKRSCTEVQSELYVALDSGYISQVEFVEGYDQAARARSAIRGFINYLMKYEKGPESKPLNPEPRTPEPSPLNLSPEPLNPEPRTPEPSPLNLEP